MKKRNSFAELEVINLAEITLSINQVSTIGITGTLKLNGIPISNLGEDHDCHAEECKESGNYRMLKTYHRGYIPSVPHYSTHYS